MSTLSSTTLFHFTNKEALISIIKNGFYSRYSIEKYPFDDFVAEEAVPMVSFCDIPLSKVYDHAEEYGKYAIGMNRDWAIKNGMAPVFYIQENGKIYSRLKKVYLFLLQDLYQGFVSGTSALKVSNRELLMDINHILKNTKQIEGISLRSGEKSKFYDEKEWRYYPDYKRNGLDINHIPVNYVNFEKEKLEYTKELEKNPLRFTIEDIKYIITEKDEEKETIIDLLKLRDPLVDKLIITQKLQIFSMNQIETDF